jgi:antitoxin component of RelBE/YafQ-DinJ toxin-antitoxin module
MAKLTLSVDDQAIKAAKNWARVQGLSVSQMVSIFFSSVTRSKQVPDEMPPVLRKLAGIMEKEETPIEKYYDHIVRKYLCPLPAL